MTLTVQVRRVLTTVLVLTCWARTGQAQTMCDSLPRPVIGAGGSASKPLIARISGRLAALSGDQKVTLIYQSPGACFGITPFLPNAPNLTGNASYWDPWDGTGAPVEKQCALAPGGIKPDFGMLGTAATLCAGVTALPDGIGEFRGPVTSWSLIVPTASSETSISGEALYFIYGFGPENGQAAPWNVRSQLKGRNATAAALVAIAVAAGITPARMVGNVGTDEKDNQTMVTSVAAATPPSAGLGFVSSEVADLSRSTVRTLAYQHFGQACGFLPDSSATANDKANVRDGHYYLWSPYRFYAPISAPGQITKADVKTVIGYFTGEVAPPAGLPILEDEIRNGNIPECAMTVWRDTDLGPLYSVRPPDPCICLYEKVASGVTACTPCTQGGNECTGTTSCHHGYCEATP